jgi:predicted nucleotidyltransferase
MPATVPKLEELTKALRHFAERQPAISKLEVFGSVATGRATNASDLDLLVTFGPGRPAGLDYFGWFEAMETALRHLLGLQVHLVDRAALQDDLFGYNANRQARAIYERS